tara:strand:+ start:2514 stop:2870 length:357 start_codon:yes stop_codon:yes gene_type:complete
MVKYCPVCETEYQDATTNCAEDNAKLSNDKPAHPLDEESFVAFYAATNELEARRIVAILADENVEGMVRETTNTVFPGAAGMRFLVFVPANARSSAAQLVQQAINDEVLSQDGSYVTG